MHGKIFGWRKGSAFLLVVLHMKLRKATEEDAHKVAHVMVKSYNMDSLEEAVEAFRREMMQEKAFVVAEEGDAIVGIASWQMHDVPKHMLAELHRIAVLPEFKGKGVAKRVFEFLLDDCDRFYRSKGHALRKMFVLTHASNKRAHAFYEKLGFKLEARLPSHYYDGEDELVFSMFLEKKKD
ncbi:MAG: GNAT family N-acetyltransferase [Candidatus Diapherotrites archaeon]|nr:GNAT family N-acetyltransferase [Candidatus Diapherotrites archaeon]